MTLAGHHFMLELGGVEPALLDDAEFITATIRAAVAEAQLTLLGEIQHSFEPQGVTAIALLAESHLAIHTWPESRYAAVDLFTCGDQAPAETACHSLIAAFAATDVRLHRLRRGLVAAGETPVRVLARASGRRES